MATAAMTTTPAYEVIVIGGSFAGLSAAMQLARARRRVCMVDAGQPRNRFAAASHGFFGQDGEPPLAMIERARRKLAAYPTVVFVQGTVVSATPQQRAGSPENGFEVVLGDGATMEAHGWCWRLACKTVCPRLQACASAGAHRFCTARIAMGMNLRASGWACCTTRQARPCMRS
jgi:glycine/D-amino acid oxidase-like deaminating enzyme